MALLQIAEPGQSAAPHEHRLAVGIDLGTTNSLVATVRSGLPEVIADASGRVLLPSAVWYGSDGPAVVGHEALAKRVDESANVVVSVKRWLGRSLAELTQRGELEQSPYVFLDNADPSAVPTVKTPAGPRNAVEISADILRVLRSRAEAALGAEPNPEGLRHRELLGAVITVPAHFDDAQRQATKDAAQLAGIPVLRLLNEPTAAAIAYGLDAAAQGRFVVYDLGGGTFDVSVLQLSRGVFEVLATGGDTALGGDDFDAVVADVLRTALAGYACSPMDLASLRVEARWAKEALSTDPTVAIDLALPSGARLQTTLTQADFEARTRALLARTLEATRRALRDAGLTVSEVDGVVLVGGATRMPAVRHAVAKLFGRDPLVHLDPDQVVALGAAMQANLLAGNRAPGEDWLLLDVIPLSLGIETMGGLVERIVPRNTTIPAVRAQEFTTFRDGQTALALHVVQGERELVADCRSLARFELRGIPPMVAGLARIQVSFQVDADGLLAVSARELSTGVSASVTVKPSYGLGEEAIARMLQDAFGQAEFDARQRALTELKVDADRLLEALQSALAQDSALLAPEDLAKIEHCAQELRALRRSDEVGETAAAALRAGIAALSAASEPFAARRMDDAVRKALTGRKLDGLET